MPHDAHSIRKLSSDFVIPVGTQVVLKVSKAITNDQTIFKKPGSVAVVVQSPSSPNEAYLIEFSDGGAVNAYGHELVLRRREIDELLSYPNEDLNAFVFYRCQVGSKAFGLADEHSDDDIRGIFMPPAELHWSLNKLPEQLEGKTDKADHVFWEIEKFLMLALKANPNILETLWTPMVLESNELSDQLRANRRLFLSKHVFKTYSGYVLSQFRRMSNAIERTGEFRTKHAMHLVRLLYSGINAIQTGEILIDVAQYRDELLRIKEGQLTFDQIRDKALKLDKQFQTAFENTSLPEQPNFEFANDFLVQARRWMADRK